MDPPNRITKDTSARKNTPSSISADIHSSIANAAIKASRDAYMNIMIQGYQNKIAAIESERQGLIDEAVQKALANQNHQIQKLEETISQMKADASSTKTHYAIELNRMDHRATGQENTIRNLKRQLEVGPNSWVEFHVTGKNRKKRTYVKRPTAQFTDALADLGKNTIDAMQFRVGGEKVQGTEKRTLQQLKVKDGDTIEILPPKKVDVVDLTAEQESSSDDESDPLALLSSRA